MTEALEGLALVAYATGEAERGTQLLGTAEALREAIGVPLPEVHRADYQHALEEGRRVLGEHAFAEARARGRALTAERTATDAPGLRASDWSELLAIG